MRRWILAASIMCVTIAPTPAQETELSWYSIDGGGVVRSAGDGFELSGTIGQPDAGTMTGGVFDLTGGFWFAILPTDCNEDGAVNGLDHAGLIQCLTGPGGPVPAGCDCFDVDASGAVDLGDFAAAQLAVSGA